MAVEAGDKRRHGGHHLHSLASKGQRFSLISDPRQLRRGAVSPTPDVSWSALARLPHHSGSRSCSHSSLRSPLWGGPGKEKALPRLRKRTTAAGTGAMLDYVFRIVRIGGGNEFNLSYRQELDDDARLSPETQSKSMPCSPYVNNENAVDNLVNLQIDRACQSMRHQILARAFFGWLSYCRHLRTVRKHLLYLVDTKEMSGEEEAMPVDEEFWKRCRTEKTPELEEEFHLRVYWKGIEGSKHLRRQAWPYLLKLFRWDEDPEPKISEFTTKYREDVENWRVLEAEVRRQDEEDFLAARHRKVLLPEREFDHQRRVRGRMGRERRN